MKKILSTIFIIAILFGCKPTDNNKTFTVNGQLKNIDNQKIYLEELSFNKKDPEVIDTADIKNGVFTLHGFATEDGLYRLRLEKLKSGFLFINDNNTINFTANLNDVSLNGPSFSTSANASLKNFITVSDSLLKNIQQNAASINQLQKSGAKQTDSFALNLITNFNIEKEEMTKYCLQYADTAKSPAVALFAATAAPIDVEKIQVPLQKLVQRFPKHDGIATVANFAKQQLALKKQQAQASQQQGNITIGSLAPDITLNDVNDKQFSLSKLKGKYVLIDFWASWCGPCRGENPNVVAAYNQFKDKNFTVLGVSLDINKEAWLKAIKDDNLTWQHISDLKEWQSAAASLYGVSAIPYNVLIDPSGKVIAIELRGPALMQKLNEVLK